MSYTFINVKRYKRQPYWPDGNAISCTRCRYEKKRTGRVVVVADLKYGKTKTKLPVAYCKEHDPTRKKDT